MEVEVFSLGNNSFVIWERSEPKMSQMASASPGGIGPSLPGEIKIENYFFVCCIDRLTAVYMKNFEVSG